MPYIYIYIYIYIYQRHARKYFERFFFLSNANKNTSRFKEIFLLIFWQDLALCKLIDFFDSIPFFLVYPFILTHTKK
jgi:hypothetical protein